MANNNITENLKKYFYSGIGFASHASDLIKGSMDEYVKAGRMSESDGKGIVEDMIKKIDEQKVALEDKYNQAVHSFVSMTTDEMGVLQRKIESLEMQLKARGSNKNTSSSSGSSRTKSQSSIKKAVKSGAKKAAPIKKAVAKKAAAVKKAVAKKAASVKKAVAKKVAPVKKGAAKKAAKKAASKK